MSTSNRRTAREAALSVARCYEPDLQRQVEALFAVLGAKGTDDADFDPSDAAPGQGGAETHRAQQTESPASGLASQTA
jgi:hypothetical protein